MDLQQQTINNATHFIKRKRTKRLKLSSPLTLALTAVDSSSSARESVDRCFNPSMASSTSSEFVEGIGKEEENMANCLILLAHGFTEKSSNMAMIGGALRSTKVGELQNYECKTCNRCFPSFQALGGHRASHRKPKEAKKSPETMENIDMSTTLSLQIQSKFKKFHECSICGAEFSSGQALGGHMRRHRSIAAASTSVDLSSSELGSKRSRNYPELDLNLPAPEDSHGESKFSFASNEQVIVFSSSPLVDCHY